MSHEARFRLCREVVERMHPGKSRLLAKPVTVNWGLTPWAEGVGPIHQDWAANPRGARYDELLRPEGPIVFAGEHLSYVVFWQEGAALSAHEAMRVLTARPRSGARRPDRSGRSLRRKALGGGGAADIRCTSDPTGDFAMLKRALLLAAALALPLSAASAAPADVAAAVAAPGRPEAAIGLDEVRKPAEVLRWLGLERGDRVLDYFTGTGYYAEIMARAVGPTGSVTGWNSPGFGRNEQVRDGARRHPPALAQHGLLFDPDDGDLLRRRTATISCLLHLVYHDAYWESEQFGLPRIDPNTVTAALFRAAKPGGTVAVIDHVAAPGRETRAEVEATHRIDPGDGARRFRAGGLRLRRLVGDAPQPRGRPQQERVRPEHPRPHRPLRLPLPPAGAVIAAFAALLLQATAADLGWLSGRWLLEGDGRWTEEVWSDPQGGMMLGFSREGRGDTVGDWEFLRIAPGREGVLTYSPSPTGGRRSPSGWSRTTPPARRSRIRSMISRSASAMFARATG